MRAAGDRHPPRPERAVMYRQGMPRADPCDGVDRLTGIKVLITQTRPPATDRDDGKINRLDVKHMSVQSRIARIPEARGVRDAHRSEEHTSELQSRGHI